VPVRLTIVDNDDDLALRTGMSATVTVDTGVSRGLGALYGKAFAGTK
jgi:membrane fusion protein (multidrug efflux system)